MLALGVDLASQPRNTSIAVLDGRRLVLLESVVDDDRIVELARQADAVGIDAPLGWPSRFVETVVAHHRGEQLPEGELPELRLRLTDHATRELVGKIPLSVSTDRIGVVALRAVRILERLAGPGADRSGAAGVYETYPGGAVAAWELARRSYKTAGGEAVRGSMVRALRSYLALDGFEDRLRASDDDLDALLCAAVVALARLGRTHRPEAAQLETARVEGWIHVPAGPLADLCDLT